MNSSPERWQKTSRRFQRLCAEDERFHFDRHTFGLLSGILDCYERGLAGFGDLALNSFGNFWDWNRQQVFNVEPLFDCSNAVKLNELDEKVGCDQNRDEIWY